MIVGLNRVEPPVCSERVITVRMNKTNSFSSASSGQPEVPTTTRVMSNHVGGAVSDTATGIINGVTNVIDNWGKVINGVVTGDTELAKDGGVNLLKTAAIATLRLEVG